jgi:dTDP-4-dehydrorhamnose reductase
MGERVLILGAKGQLGNCLNDIEPEGFEVTYADIEECDLTDPDAVRDYIGDVDPKTIINCSAYTAVDKAEEEEALAYRINRDAVQYIADNCGQDRRLIHISTDFVFDGRKTTPYLPGDTPAPLGVYGASKLAGENAALNTIPEQVMVIRTAWLYSIYGVNFVKTMLRLMAEKDEISVVNDQRGSPTYAGGLAEVIWDVLVKDCFAAGIYHWTDAGNVSWHDFALAIQAEGRRLGILTRTIPVRAIPAENYPTAATRPLYSLLDSGKLLQQTGREGTPWHDNLVGMVLAFDATHVS